MSQTVVSKGKNIMEAIELGLQLLGTNKEQVSIEVVQQESKGFLKLRSKQAVVRLTKIKEAQENKELQTADTTVTTNKALKTDVSFEALEEMVNHMEPSDDQTNEVLENLGTETYSNLDAQDVLEDGLAGRVWVKEREIFCKPSPLHYPTITVGKGVTLKKNNELVVGTTVVASEDVFELQTKGEIKETRWNMKIDSDRLNVILHVEPGMERIFLVKDIEPDFNIVLDAEEIIEYRNKLEYKQVLSELENLRVIHGFNHDEIMKAVNTEEAGDFTIASGIKPKEGENGKIEIVVDLQKKTGPQERNNGTVDFREVQVIPTVRKGQVIAIVHPPIPGTPGFTVSNEPIVPKPVYPLILRAGQGIVLIENGTKVVATEEGRPLIEQRGLMVKVYIVPKLIHPTDVNISSGNIRFKGDIEVRGNVEKGMIVEAEGEITVLKNVYASTISGKNGISILGNSIGSTISGGNQNIFTSEMINLFTDVRVQMNKMVLSIHQLMNMPAFKMTDYSKSGLFPLIKLLVDKKFQSLGKAIKQLMELGRAGNHLLDIEWLSLIEQLRMCFLSAVPNEFHTLEKKKELLKRIEQMIEKYDQNNQECCVTLMNAQGNTIFSSGDVKIQGQGCYNSKIHASGHVSINGVFRGGEVFARHGVTIRESGSNGGVVSKIIVPSHETIKIDYVRAGTIIQVGKIKLTFQEDHRYITARLNESGKIIF